MPPKPSLSLSIPANAFAAASADAEADANKGAAPGGASGGGAPAGRTAALFAELRGLFAAQRAAGVDVHAGQDPASYAQLDAGVRALMAAYCADPAADWERFAFWGADHYIRNLVAAEEGVLELMVICWAPGQVSRVHNHGASHCWMTCLAGAVDETHYAVPPAEADPELFTPRSPAARPLEVPGVIASLAPCPPLHRSRTAQLLPGQTAYISDGIALHAVGCAAGPAGAAGGVTLHLYAPPIRRAKLYEAAENRVTLRHPGFFSAGGAPLGSGASAAAVPGRAPPAPMRAPAEASGRP